MTDTNLWFRRSAGHHSAVNLPRDEPSHIHIARPSRALRRDNSAARVEPTDEVCERAAAEVSGQAA